MRFFTSERKDTRFSNYLLILFAVSFISAFSLFGCSGAESPKGKGESINESSSIEKTEEKPVLNIAISKHYPDYSEWLLKADPTVKYHDMYTISLEESLEILENCDGLLLSGGPDVDPVNYEQPQDADRCEIDLKRDTLEFKLIEKAREMQMPILGICRGEQILNVAYSGSLVVDIPDDFGTDIAHKCKHPEECLHDVNIVKGTILNEISGVEKGTVNTNHHQAVERLADGFVVSAYSTDGLTEAFEWKNRNKAPNGEPVILAVQWHPEKLKEDNPLSMPIARYFLQKAAEFNAKKDADITNE